MKTYYKEAFYLMVYYRARDSKMSTGAVYYNLNKYRKSITEVFKSFKKIHSVDRHLVFFAANLIEIVYIMVKIHHYEILESFSVEVSTAALCLKIFDSIE